MKKSDILTPIGFLFVLAVLFFGIAQDKAGIGAFIDMPSFVITVGGSFAAVLITFSLDDLKQIPGSIKVAMQINRTNKVDLVSQFKELSRKARKDGLLSIEDDVEEIENEFMKNGLELVIDGLDIESIEEILENQINIFESKYENSSKIFKLWGSFAPAMGMVGTLIGLIQMLAGGLNDATTISSGMAKALITTFYGTILANTILNPIGYNIQNKCEKDVQLMEMMVCGIGSLQNGESSRVIEEKLLTYLSDSEKKNYFTREVDDSEVDGDVA
ncbi:motility protein A [Terrisporobacter glycolicus]|uniref:motility protein A n=1 Tax=Terrisporobacter glycolicus TaxID=36841 RepID=UPI000AF12D1D